MVTITNETTVVKYFSELKGKYSVAILDQLIKFGCKYETVFVSQKLIADIVGCERPTVNRLLGYLASSGVISKLYRHRDTCIYKLSKIFYDFSHQLKDIFSSLKKLHYLKELYSFLPTAKTVIESNFKKLLHHNSIIIKSYQYQHDNLYDEAMFYSTDLQSPLSFQNITEEIEQIFGVLIKKDVDMQEFPISSTMTALSEALSLTKWAHIRLSIFPEASFEYAIKQIKFINKKDTFNWLFNICKEFCVNNNLHVPWTEFYELCDKYQLSSKPIYKKEKTFNKVGQLKRNFYKIEIDRPIDEQIKYIATQHSHFEKHSIQPIVGTVDRKFIHPSYRNIQNPFL